MKLFGEYLRAENILQNYDEFTSLKALQSIDFNDKAAVADFQSKHHLSDDDLEQMKKLPVLSERKIQDYRSAYNDIRDQILRREASDQNEESTIDWDDVVFEIDLLRSQEINLDYILEQIFENNRKPESKPDMLKNVRRMIQASIGHRAKESLLIDFIEQTNLDELADKDAIMEAFYSFARKEQRREAEELIQAEKLNREAAEHYLNVSMKRGFAGDNGTELNAVLPRMSPLAPQYLSKKKSVFRKLKRFIEKFKGVDGGFRIEER